MTTFQKITLFLLRVSLGWMFFYAGITKVLNPNWSASGYLEGAKTFAGFYHWLLQPTILPTVNFINEWGLVLLGVSLILGVFVRISSALGALLMLMYYLPPLQFPYPNAHAFIVDEHIIYIAALSYLAAIKAGRVWGLENWCSNLPLCKRFSVLRRLFG
jgi:thiosulfate dehydrogenase [quinone] large subunit